MRIADKMAFEQVRLNLGKNRSQMADLQNQAATQKRVTKPSDDPVAASRVLSSRIELQGNNQYLKNVDYAKSFLEYSDQSLGELAQHLMRAKELTIGQANDASSNASSRAVVAAEIRQIYNQVVQIGNRKLGERSIFSGYKTIEYLIAHSEYMNYKNHELWLEKDKNYETIKTDPHKDFMKALRKKVKGLKN